MGADLPNLRPRSFQVAGGGTAPLRLRLGVARLRTQALTRRRHHYLTIATQRRRGARACSEALAWRDAGRRSRTNAGVSKTSFVPGASVSRRWLASVVTLLSWNARTSAATAPSLPSGAPSTTR